MSSELAGVGALASRWRQLELASWVATLKTVLRRHTAGARRSWFHLYGLLVLGRHEQAPADHGAGAMPGEGAAAGGLGDAEAHYQHVASTIEAFVQTSTIGEFEARLRLLDSFRSAHLQRMSAHLPAVCPPACLPACLPRTICPSHPHTLASNLVTRAEPYSKQVQLMSSGAT